MRRRRSACSEAGSEIDIDGIAETELGKLQREFRIMEGNRQAYSIESQDIIRRQLRDIQKLQNEHDQLQCSLCVSESPLHRWHDAEATENLCNMLGFRDTVEEQLDREQKTLKHLNQEILRMERKLADQRREGTPMCLSEKSPAHQIQKASRILENKLHRGNIRFNKMLAKNAQLREDLKILHVERKQFMQLYCRLEKELQDIRKDIRDMMNRSNFAYDGRVEAQCKSVMLKEKTDKDLAQYRTEMAELERVIAHDHCLKTFISTKNNERSGQEENQDLNRKQVIEEKHEKRIDFLEEAFHKIHFVTGEKDLDKLVETFIEIEDRNFALFNYVNEKSNEAETLKDQINQIRQKIEQFSDEWQRQRDQHCVMVQDITAQQQDTEMQAQRYELRITSVNKILDQLKTGIDSVFHKTDCDWSVIEDKLGSSTGIRDSTIINYLGLVEQRTNELLTMQGFLSSKDLDKDYNLRVSARHLLGQSPTLPRGNRTVEPPLTGGENDTEESLPTDEDRPFSKEEIHQQVMKKIQRRTDKVSKTSGSNTRRRSFAVTPLSSAVI